MSWGVRQQLKIVGLVLVMRGDIQCHYPLQEKLRSRVVAEQRISVHIKEFAGGRMGTSLGASTGQYGGVQTKQAIEPFFNLVPGSITDRCFELDLT